MKSKIYRIAMLCASLLLTHTANAENAKPIPSEINAERGSEKNERAKSEANPRFNKMITWKKGVHIPLLLKKGTVTLVHLPEKERIKAYTLGDDASFVLHTLGEELPNIASIHATQEEKAQSNISIVGESGRIYNLYVESLSAEETKAPDLMLYIALPEGEVRVESQAQEAAATHPGLEAIHEAHRSREYLETMPKGKNIRHDYRMFGDTDIAPYAIYDDGKRTYFDFRDELASRRLLVLYQVVDGVDSVVNYRYEKGMMIAEAISPEGWTLRSGTKSICVKPKTPFSRGR